jgi:hypothetical protein
MDVWQDEVLLPKLQEMEDSLINKIEKLAYGGTPVPQPRAVDKAEINALMT